MAALTMKLPSVHFECGILTAIVCITLLKSPSKYMSSITIVQLEIKFSFNIRDACSNSLIMQDEVKESASDTRRSL